MQAGESPRGSAALFNFQAGVRSISATVDTQSGGDWLRVELIHDVGSSDSVLVYVNAAALQPGTYQGTITVTSPTLGPARVPVTLTVVAAPGAETALTVTPARLSLTAAAGEFVQSDPLRVESGGTPVLFTVGSFTADGGPWLPSFDIQAAATAADGQSATPATVKVGAVAVQPGAYYGSLTFQAPPKSVQVPVTFSVTASAAFPPVNGGGDKRRVADGSGDCAG